MTLTHVHIDDVDVSRYRTGISIAGWNGTTGYADVSVTNSDSHDNQHGGMGTYAQAHYRAGHPRTAHPWCEPRTGADEGAEEPKQQPSTPRLGCRPCITLSSAYHFSVEPPAPPQPFFDLGTCKRDRGCTKADGQLHK